MTERGWEYEPGRFKRFKLPTCAPAIITPEPRDVRGAKFDPVRVDRVLDSFALMRHTQGRWAGRPLIPDPWEIAYILAPTFGWVSFDAEFDAYVRIIRELYVDVPRKNGKTTLVGGIGVYLTCGDGEQGAQVITAATTKDQAGFVFNPVRQITKSSPDLNPYVQTLAGRIVHRPTASYMEVIANAADAQHGGNIHGGIIDELHLQKTRGMYEALSTGTGSRAQPLIVLITTADAGEQDTIYNERRTYCEKVARRIFPDPTFHGVVFAAGIEDDPFAETTWKKANPGYGKSPTKRYLTKAANGARNSAAEKSSFKRLHCGLRTKQAVTYIELDIWDRHASIVDEDLLKGRAAYGGMDLATTSDLCSVCWLFPDGQGGVDALWRHWMPERAFDRMSERTAGVAESWRNNGFLTVTPGDVADYDYIEQQINRDRENFRVRSIGYDRWNASQLVNNLTNQNAPMVQLGQGFASMSGPLKQIKHMLLAGDETMPLFRHGGNPLMRWQVDNLAVAMDAAGNVKPDKSKSGDKIDGFSAAVDAMAEVMAAKAHIVAPAHRPPRLARPAASRNPLATQQF